MGNNPSVLKCLPESEDAKKLKWLEERCTQLAIENERLHQKVREAQLTTQGGSLHGGSALTLDNAPAASSPMLTRRDTSSTSNMTEMAVSAAAEATAQYQRSLVRVEVDNETDPGVATIVTVRAPDRPYLLGDMTGALLGLGLAVRQAAIAKVDGMESTASLQFSLQDGGRAITEEKRLQSIEQRLQQRFCGRQGLNGGVRRLVVERFLRAEPPWTHEALEPLAPPADSQALWLKSLGLALGPGGSSAQFMGADSTALAARCAAEILPEMIRMRLPPGCTVGREQTSDEWLLLLESDATVVQAAPGSKSPAARRLSGGSGGGASRDSSPRVGLGLTGLGSPATRGGGGGVRPPAPRLPGLRGLGGGSGVGSEVVAPPSGSRPQEGERIVLKAGSVLFEKIIPSAPLPSAPLPLDDTLVTAAAAAAGWAALESSDEGEGVIVRAIHVNALQQRLVTMRESFAREHAQILADNPLFAPMTTTELLALCRRATVVQVPADYLLLPVTSALEQVRQSADATLQEIHDVVQEATFGIILGGGLQIGLSSEAAGAASAADAKKPDANGGAALDCAHVLPETLPLAHLSVNETFGVWGTLGGTLAPGVKMAASTGGASLLCWPRDQIHDLELRKLSLLEGGTSLLERCWIARSPLALCLGQVAFAHSSSPNGHAKDGSNGSLEASNGSNGSLSSLGEASTRSTGSVSGLGEDSAKRGLLAANGSGFGGGGAAWKRIIKWRKATNALLKVLQPMPLEEAMRLDASGELEHTERMLVVVTSGEVLRRASSDTQIRVRRKSVVQRTQVRSPRVTAISSSTGSSANGETKSHMEMEVSARMPRTCHSISDLSNRLYDLGLVLVTATSDATDGTFVNDTFRVRAPIPEGGTESEAAAAVQTKLKLLGAHQMHPGDACLARAGDGSSRISRLEPIGNTKPAVALIDLGVLGATLAMDKNGDDARVWRRFLRCHAPWLLPTHLDGFGTPQEALASVEQQGVAQLSAAGDATTPGKVWLDQICAFLLYRLRQAAGEGEVGVGLEHLELGTKLGEGGYGVVRLARHRVSGSLYAVKSILKSRIRRIDEQRTFELLERERMTLKQLGLDYCASGGKGPGLTRLVCSGHDSEWLRLTMPAYLGGDLSSLLEAVGEGLSEEDVQFYAGCLVLALHRLHCMGVAFRDLKPENVLLSDDGWPVLTDFGLVAFVKPGDGSQAVLMNKSSAGSGGGGGDDEDEGGAGGEPGDFAYSMVGTPEFMAPEVVSGAGHTTDCDWWSLGVTLCELLTLHTPFRADDDPGGANQRTYANILHGKYSSYWVREKEPRLAKRTKQLIDGLLTVDTATRLGGRQRGVESLRVHPFFWGLSWEDLEMQNLRAPHAVLCADKVAAAAPFPTTTPPVNPAASVDKRISLMAAAKGGAGTPKPPSDAAAAALDKLFDFSEWGVER